MKYAKIDANQNEIVKSLRSVGAFVQSLASVGKGCPDLLVAFKGKWHLMEIKDSTKIHSKRELSQDELDWILRACKQGPIHLVETSEQALKIIMETS